MKLSVKYGLSVSVAVLATLALTLLILSITCGGKIIYAQFLQPAKTVKPSRLSRLSWPKAVQDSAAVVTNRVSQCLHDANIPHFPAYGTLIGCARNAGVIPWDNDVDFGVMKGDVEPALQALREKWGNQLTIKPYFPLSATRAWVMSFKDIPEVSLDIFEFALNTRLNRVMLTGGLLRYFSNDRGMDASLLFPLVPKSVKFGDGYITGPRDIRELCDDSIPGWDKEFIIHRNHSAGSNPWGLMHRKLSVPITPEVKAFAPLLFPE
jgi:hypothetical protein